MLGQWKIAAAALAATALVALSGQSALAAEPLKVGLTFLNQSLDPAKGSDGWSLVSEGVGETLFTVDKKGVLTGQLAQSARRLSDHEWEVRLTAGRMFSDGTPVDAKAVSAALNHTIAVNKAALATGGKLVFTPSSDLTIRVTTEKPVAALGALLAEWPMIVYHLEADGSARLSGPYAVKSFKPDASLELEPNPYFPGADHRSPVTIQKFGDAQAMALAYEAGDLDLAFGLPSEALARLKANPDLAVKAFPVAYQYLGLLNVKNPPLADVVVRRAVDLAIDRGQLVAAINGGSPATGAFAPYFPFAGKTQRPSDVEAAKKLLDSAGWRVGADGIRVKNDKPLVLRIVTYPQRPDLVTMLPVVKSDLAAIGAKVETSVVEDPSSVAAAGDFDILLWAQNTAPTGDPAFFFNSMLRTGAALNYGGVSDPALDTVLDGFAQESDPAKRAAIAAKAEAITLKEAQMLYLVSPDWYVGVSKRLSGYESWGSDYHVLRADIGETPAH